MKTDFGDFLLNSPTLAEFGPSELAILERSMMVSTYPGGHQFLGGHRRDSGLYLIVEGQVVVHQRRNELREMEVIERLGPGDLFGLVSLIDHRHEWASYRAEGPVTVAYLPANVFDLLFTANAPIAHHFQSLIALQLVRDFRNCARALSRKIAEQQSK